MILKAIAEKLKRQSKDDFKGRHFAASLICRLFCYSMFKVQERIVNVRSYIRKVRRGLEPVRWFVRVPLTWLLAGLRMRSRAGSWTG